MAAEVAGSSWSMASSFSTTNPVLSTGTSTTTIASGTGKLSLGVCEHLVVGQRAKKKTKKKERKERVLDSTSLLAGC